MLTQNIIYDSDCYIKEGGNTNAQSKAANFGKLFPNNIRYWKKATNKRHSKPNKTPKSRT